MEQTIMATTMMSYEEIAAQQPPKAIHTKEEHRHWMRVLDGLISKPEDEITPAEARYGETIALLIEVYEKQHFTAPTVSPVEMIKGLLEQRGLKHRDLLDVFKHESTVSNVMSGKRALTVEQIRRLAKKFHVSPAVFIA